MGAHMITNQPARPPSLEDRIEAFYTSNEFEELSIPDMMLKFGGSEAATLTAVSRLRVRGFMLERVSVYRLKQAGPAS